jgi:hypothetical protein
MVMSIKRSFFAFTLLWLNLIAFGQNQENSPYSRFGIGELVDPHFSAQGNMGGWTAAYTDINFLNYLNPASLGTLSATSMELGMYGRHNTLKDRFSQNTQWGGNLSHLALGFPIRNPVNDAMNKIERNFFWGTGLTVTPFSRTSYNIRTIEFVEGAGRVRRNYSGDGGTYKILLGNGFRYKDFSVGLNAGLLLGSIERERIIALDDFINSFTEYFEDKQTFRSFLWSAGAQYRLWLKKPDKNAAKRISRYIMLGAYGNTSTALKTELDRNYIKANDLLKVVDTILSEQGTRFNTRMPGQYTLGASFVDENKLRIGFDFTQTLWSQFESPLDNIQMKNTWSLNTGFEYIPNINSIGKFTNRVRYRAGVRLGQDPRSFNDQLNRFEISAGVGLPFVISREVSYLHLGVSYGKIYGNNIPVTENYFRINFGFTFIDNSWFVKRKFY